MLSIEDHRDAETWGIRLLELQDQGFAPEATIADAGKGLSSGQALVMPKTACRGDVFHALQDVQALLTFLENRAYATSGVTADLERKKAGLRRRGQRILACSPKTSPGIMRVQMPLGGARRTLDCHDDGSDTARSRSFASR